MQENLWIPIVAYSKRSETDIGEAFNKVVDGDVCVGADEDGVRNFEVTLGVRGLRL